MSNGKQEDIFPIKRLLARSDVRAKTRVPAKVAYLYKQYEVPVRLLKREFSLSKSAIHKYISKDGMVDEKGGRPPLLTESEQA